LVLVRERPLCRPGPPSGQDAAMDEHHHRSALARAFDVHGGSLGSIRYDRPAMHDDATERRPTPELRTLMDGLVFGEQPRWHQGRLWFSDWGTQEVIAVDIDGNSEVILHGPSFP